MPGRSLSPEENARVLDAIRDLLKQAGENQSTLAPKLGIKQPTLSAMLSGRHKASHPLAWRVAAISKLPPQALLNFEAGSAELPPSFDEQPGWAAAAAGARADMLRIRPRDGVAIDRALAVVGGWSGPSPIPVVPHIIASFAFRWLDALETMAAAENDAGLEREMETNNDEDIRRGEQPVADAVAAGAKPSRRKSGKP